MDCALVRQVLVTDPINCGRGNQVAKGSEVSRILQELKPQPISKTSESCRQRVKRLVEIYKVCRNLSLGLEYENLYLYIEQKAELDFLTKTGTDEEFAEPELNTVELSTS